LAIELGPEDSLLEDEDEHAPPAPISSPLKSKSSVPAQTPNTPPKTVTISLDPVEITTPVEQHPVAEEIIETPTSKLWPMVTSETESIDTPDSKVVPHELQASSSLDRETLFSPQEVRKRSSSMKKSGGSTEISVISRSNSQGHSDDFPIALSPRSPEFSLTARNRSQSERRPPNKQFRRLSSGARLEGAARAAIELAKFDSPQKDPVSPIISADSSEPKKAARRSSANAGSYVRSLFLCLSS
jgi:hypothetical protein